MQRLAAQPLNAVPGARSTRYAPATIREETRMKPLRTLAAAAATAIGLQAHALSTVTTDFTDLWYIPSESGWGINIIQQEDTLFATLFVYGPNNQPVWYVASAVTYQGQSGSTLSFSGPLYQTTGPWFGAGVFPPQNVTVRQVGTLTFSTSQVTTANLSYSVDGVVVNKTIQRQTWRNQDLSGSYRGAMIGNYSGCSSGNGPYESTATFNVTQNGSAVTIQEVGTGYTCTYNGTYTAAGNSGTVAGSGSCTDGFSQQFVASEVKTDLNYLSMRFTSQLGTTGQCLFAGRAGGMRRN